MVDLNVAIRELKATGKRVRPLVVAPTGSGKTVTFSHMAKQAMTMNKRCLIVVHRQELMFQTSETLKNFGIPHGFLSAGITISREMVQIGMVQSLKSRINKIPPPDLIIIDEAHHATSASYLSPLIAWQGSLVVGFTATPSRLDGRGLGDIFDRIVMGPKVEWLMERGFLSQCKYWAPPMVADYSNVHITAGDYNQGEAAAAMSTADVIGDCVRHYKKLSDGLPAVAFCVTVAHAQLVAERFRSAGVAADVIHGNQTPEDRARVVRQLGSGELQVLTSCEIINEGFDLPVVTTAILLRKTQSLGLHLQQIGRVLRPHPSKPHSIVIDHVGNLLTHGRAEDEREWSLEGKKRKKGAVSDGNTQCPQCFSVHPRAPECPECGFVKPSPEGKDRVEIDGDLVEFAPPIKVSHSEAVALAMAAKNHAEIKEIAKRQGYKIGWAWHQWNQLLSKRSHASRI